MAQYTPLAWEINVSPNGVVFDIGGLFEALCSSHDQRDARGLRYRLVTVLVFVVLAKLAGENHLRGIAQWVKRRAVALATFLALTTVQAPPATTYSRILGHAVAIDEFEQVSREFFAQPPQGGTRVHITLDGKTMRGRIPAGQSHGIHLLAAFVPDEGCVLFQVEVGRKENEIPAAGRVLKCLDLRGCLARPARVVIGDCGGGGRLSLDHQGQSARDASGH